VDTSAIAEQHVRVNQSIDQLIGDFQSGLSGMPLLGPLRVSKCFLVSWVKLLSCCTPYLR